jgi:hypothetical protein
MRLFVRYLVVTLLIASGIYAQQFCIIVSAPKKIHPVAKRLFLKRFPKGEVLKKKHYYVYAIKGFNGYSSVYNETKKVKKYYKHAYIVKGDDPEPKKQQSISKKTIQKKELDGDTLPKLPILSQKQKTPEKKPVVKSDKTAVVSKVKTEKKHKIPTSNTDTAVLERTQYFCIITLSSKVLNLSQKNLFLKLFPQGHVHKNDPYYVFYLGGFKSNIQASDRLKNVRKYYRHAYIVKCNDPEPKQQSVPRDRTLKQKPANSIAKLPILSQKQKPTEKDSVVKIEKTAVLSEVETVKTHKIAPAKQIKKPNKKKVLPNKSLPLNEPKISDKKHPKSLIFTQLSKTDKTPALDEPLILKPYQIPTPSKSRANLDYDVLSFRRYMSALFTYNNRVDESAYQKKIDYILTYIRKDRYNFDIYATAQATTGSYISPYSTTPPIINGNYKETTTGVELHADKLLYDGQYSLIHDTYSVLNKRLADIKELSAKEKLGVLGTAIYSNMYFDQERLKLFKKMLKEQRQLNVIVKKAYKTGKDSIISYIDAKNNFLELKRNILTIQTQYIYDDYILRHSIKSKSKNRYKLLPQSFDWDLKPLALLKQETINNNSDIAMESNILKIRQTDLLAQKRRYYPTVNFNSYIGYGTSEYDTFSFSTAGAGTYWQMGLVLRIPIYNRDDIRLNEEKSIYDALRQRKVLSSQIQSTLIEVDRSYGILQRNRVEKDLIKKQVDLQALKMKVAKANFLQGVRPYSVYSDAMTSFLRYKMQLMSLEQNYIKEMAILHSLVGNTRELYGEN